MSNWVKVSSKLRSEALYSLVPAKYTFTPNREDVLESRFRLRYSSTCDSYYRDWADRVDPDSPWILPDWRRALKDWDSVCRVVDEETGKVYLDKYKTSSKAKLKWSFDFGCCGLLVDQVTLRLAYEVKDGEEFAVILTGGDGEKTARYLEAGDYVTFTELENSAKLELSIHVTGEAGQVTRLFPQTIMGGVDHPLDLQVTLKPPAEILGRPRMLVGVMYSTCQAVRVDGRHFKENSSSKSGRGFLHIHLVKARDLPVRGNQAACAKCCFLPDAKKLKCKTVAKKGSDPDWNEEFLVVGITYHEIKRGALEVCISTKNSNKVGGLRLSVGYKNVIAAQTALLSKILEHLTGSSSPESRPKTEPVSDGIETDISSRTTISEDVCSPDQGRKTEVTTGRSKMRRKIYRTTTRLSDLKVIVVEDEEEVEVDDLTLASFPEADASFYATNGSLDVLNIVRWKEEMAERPSESDAAEERANHTSNLTSVVDNEEGTQDSVHVDGKSNDSNEEFSAALKDSKADVIHVGQLVNGTTHAAEKTLTAVQMSCKEYDRNGGGIFTTTKSGGFGLSDHCSDSQVCRTESNGGPNRTAEKLIPSDVGNGLMHRVQDKTESQRGDEQKSKGDHGADVFPVQNSLKYPEKECMRKTRSLSSPYRLETTSPAPRDQHSVTAPGDELEETLKKNRLLRKALSDAETKYHQESHSSTGLDQSWSGRHNGKPSAREQAFCVFRGLGMKLSVGKSHAPGASKSSEKRRGLEKYLEENVDMEMLDSQGLEIEQWLNVVNRPKQWHYCWHVLRGDMTYLS